MRSAIDAALLPLKPRATVPAVVAVAGMYVLVANWPTAFLYVGEQNASPRIVSPFEFGPMLVALILAIGLAPRFGDWDRYGATKTRTLALANAAAVVVIPQLVFFSSLLIFYPADGEPSASALFPIAGNVAIASLLAVVATGALGNLLGPLIWFASLYTVMLWQSHAPSRLAWSPLSMSHTASGELDTQARWGWFLLCGAGALAVVWVRRSVPLRVALRPPEER